MSDPKRAAGAARMAGTRERYTRRMDFYRRVLLSLRRKGRLNATDTVLVVGGGTADRDAMVAAGLENVTISNLDYHAGEREYTPFAWRRLDGEQLEVGDGSYDWAIIHAGLHHMASPARGVCEMLRVARKGILCIEARDSLVMRLATRLGLSSDYELEPAFLSGGAVGGYRNGPIPNYVYRWTEREFEKTVDSYVPTHRHTFFYEYGFNVPVQRFAMAHSPLFRAAGRVLSGLAKVAAAVMPRQGNQFAMGVLKNTSRQPWLLESLQFDAGYLAHKYDRDRYQPASRQEPASARSTTRGSR
jgi:ubiquinone/menaquinone biosynthesis C-methylase UbiE